MEGDETKGGAKNETKEERRSVWGGVKGEEDALG